MSILEKLEAPGPKKILSLDGGGILGLMSVEILLKLERDLRKETNTSTLLLSDYFDMVCGTSTGAIIASCIAAGMSMEQILEFYINSGEEMFDKASFFKRLRYEYEDEKLAEKIKKELNLALGYSNSDTAATLGDKNIKTLLMMVLRNHTTDSPWPVSNNPKAKYNQKSRPDCNLNLPLWQLVRASTAAPTYFPPEEVTFARGTQNEYTFTFVDGGVTTYNNPSFLAFEMVTAKPYNINWKTGVDELLIVSVGTGDTPKPWPELDPSDMNIIHYAKNIPTALMYAASSGWDRACRTIGYCRFGGEVDREFGTMVLTEQNDPNSTAPKLFSYVRYDPDVTAKGLADLELTDIHPNDVQQMDSVANIPQIRRVGNTYANKYVNIEHLGNFI